jgi:hypothetical protein
MSKREERRQAAIAEMRETSDLLTAAFDFLRSDLDFTWDPPVVDFWFAKITARNVTTGVQIAYERRDALIIVGLYRLCAGAIVDNGSRAFMGHALDHLLDSACQLGREDGRITHRLVQQVIKIEGRTLPFIRAHSALRLLRHRYTPPFTG